VWLQLTGRTEWLSRAGEIVAEQSEPAEQLPHD
jgi:hypothetical protein